MAEVFAELPETVASKLKSKIYDSKWENKSTTKKTWQDAVNTAFENTKGDLNIVNMDVLYGFRIFDEDKTLHRQLKGINAVKFMLAHVDRMLEVYQRECETSSNEIIQRRWKVIQMMYLDREKKKSTKEIAEFYNMELSTIQKDAKEARNDLTVLFFGLDAMILHDFGNPMDK